MPFRDEKLRQFYEFLDSLSGSNAQSSDVRSISMRLELVKLQVSRWSSAFEVATPNQDQAQGFPWTDALRYIDQSSRALIDDSSDVGLSPSQQHSLDDTIGILELRQLSSQHLGHGTECVQVRKTKLVTSEQLLQITKWIRESEPRRLGTELSSLRIRDAQWLRMRVSDLNELRTSAMGVDPELASNLGRSANLSWTQTRAQRQGFIYQGEGYDTGNRATSSVSMMAFHDQVVTDQAVIIQGPMHGNSIVQIMAQATRQNHARNT